MRSAFLTDYNVKVVIVCNTERKYMKPEFKKELETLINRHSIENLWNCPDFIMAETICAFIEGMGDSLHKRDKWMGYGKKPCQAMEKRNGKF